MKASSVLFLSFVLALPAYSQSKSRSHSWGKKVRLKYQDRSTDPVSDSVLFVTPKAGETHLGLGYTFQKRNMELTSSARNFQGNKSKSTSDASVGELSVQTSLIGQFFGGVRVNYLDAQGKQESSFYSSTENQQGVGDPVIHAGYNFRSGNMKWVPSLSYQIPSGEYQRNNSGSSNAKSGFDYFEPALVFSYNYDERMIYGARASYRKSGDYEQVSKRPTGDITEKGNVGDLWAAQAFFELPGRFQPGGSLGVLRQEKGRVDRSSTEHIGSTAMTAAVYGQYRLTHQFSVLPRFDYNQFISADELENAKVEKLDSYGVGIAARFKF